MATITTDDGQQMQGFGLLRGPGTGTSDSIPVAASDGELIIPADKVRNYGAAQIMAAIEKGGRGLPQPKMKNGRIHAATGGLIEDPLRPGAQLRPAPIPSAAGLPPPAGADVMGRRPPIHMGMADVVQPETLARPAPPAASSGVPQAAARPAALPAPTAATPQGLGLPPPANRAIPQVMQATPQGALVTTTAPAAAAAPAAAPSAVARAGTGVMRALGAAAPIAGIAGAAQSIDDISNGRRDAFQRDMGVETPLGSVAADTARTLANVGDAATFGLAGRTGRGIAASLGGGSFVDGFTGSAQAAPARAAQPPATPGALPPAEQAQVRQVDNQPANAGAIAAAGPAAPIADQFIGSPPIDSAPAGSTGLPRGVTRNGNSFEGVDVGTDLGRGLPRSNALGSMADTQAQIAAIQATAPTPTGGPVIIGDPDAQRRADFFTDANQRNDLRAAQGLPTSSRARAAEIQAAQGAIANTNASRMQTGLGLMREAGETQRAALTEQGVATRARAAETRQEQANQLDQQRLGLDARRVGIEANRDQRAAAAAETEQEKSARVGQLQNLVINGTPIQQQRAMQQLAALDGREVAGSQPPSGYRRKADGNLEAIPGGPADPNSKANKALTEDQAKSAGYAIRMEDALRTINGISKTNPGAARPGVGTAVINSLPESVANALRPEDRQRVEAAQLDALDAALTLATGAAYTKEQLAGLSRAYFAQPNDRDKTVAEKQERLNKIIETARLRAGPTGAAMADRIAGSEGAPTAPAVPPQIAELQRRAANNPALAQRLRDMGY